MSKVVEFQRRAKKIDNMVKIVRVNRYIYNYQFVLKLNVPKDGHIEQDTTIYVTKKYRDKISRLAKRIFGKKVQWNNLYRCFFIDKK